MADPTPTPTPSPSPTADAITGAENAFAASLQKIIDNAPGASQATALRAQAATLLQQAQALDGPDVLAARQALQQHRQLMRQRGRGQHVGQQGQRHGGGQ